MMRKNLVNKKVVSSIGIGIMAFVTATSPALIVLAEEGEPIENPTPEATEERPSEPEVRSEPQNAGASEAIDNAQDAIDKVGEDEASAVPDDVVNALEESSENLNAVDIRVDKLDGYNNAAEEAKKDLEEATAEDEERANANLTLSEAKTETEKIAETIEKENLTEAEAKKDAVVGAQEVTYESSEAAEAAKKQAEADVAAAEEELAKAEKAKETADRHVSDAETAYNYLKGQSEKAEAALVTAQENVASARKELEEICKAYGVSLGTEKVTLTGEAGAAYNKAKEAFDLASDNFKNAKQKAEEAERAKKQAQDNKAKVEREKDDAEKKLSEARKNLEKQTLVKENAERNLDSAKKDANAKEDIFNEANKSYLTAQAESNEATAKKMQAYSDLADKNDELDQKTTDLNNATAREETAIEAFQEVEKYEPVFGAIKGYQDLYKERYAGATENTLCWEIFDGMAKEVVKFYLFDENKDIDIGSICFPNEGKDGYSNGWYKDNDNTYKNYLLVEYVENGETKTAYFDYKPIKNSIESENDIYKIELFIKTGDPENFEKKGDPCGIEEKYIIAVEDYLEKETEKNSAIQARIAAEEAKIAAEEEVERATAILNDLKDKAMNPAETAKGLKDKMSEAKASWDEAEKNKNLRQLLFNSAIEMVKKVNGEVTSYEEKSSKLAADLLEAITLLEKSEEYVKLASEEKGAAENINNDVENALKMVKTAVEKLAYLSIQEDADTEAYNKLVEECKAAETNLENAMAARDLSQEGLEKVLKAVEEAREAAAKNFAYRTQETPTTPGGTTGGGTTGSGAGGTTGGGAGGAGGGAADAGAPVPVAAPVVNIPTAAVPLAGPTVADAGDAQENGAEGLTTLEDEVTPLAGPEEMASKVNMEDFPIPLAGPVAEMGQMSWWWLLIIAVLGVTGEEMYRRHQKKQREQANIEN